MAKHIFDRTGRQVGTILDDDELPQPGCLSRVFTVIKWIIFVAILLFAGFVYDTPRVTRELPPEEEYARMMKQYEINSAAPNGSELVCPTHRFERFIKKVDLGMSIFPKEECEREFREKKKALENEHNN